MNTETKAREEICALARSMFDRGLTNGASGNISVRLDDESILVTPTGCSFGALDPDQLSRIDSSGYHLTGAKPTKELGLHQAFYETRSGSRAVVHLHSTHSVALSALPDIDENNVLPPITPYSIMRLGKVKLLPIFLPGDPAMAKAVRGLEGKRSAVLLANHGPVVAGKDLHSAVYAVEELEETAKLTLLTQGRSPNLLSTQHIEDLQRSFDIEWDD